MAERLVNHWTKTAGEAYGDTGIRGSIGERFVVDTIRSWGWDCDLFEEDCDKQIAGIDIEFKNPSWAKSYTADVKANIDGNGAFFVETGPKGWLFKPSKISDRIWHCNPDTGEMAWYGRAEMQNYIRKHIGIIHGLHKITKRAKIPFITYYRKVKV